MDYAELVTVVQELIADTGRACRFEVLSSEPADPAAPWDGPATPTVERQMNAPATFVPAAGAELGLEFIATDLLKKAQQVCLVAPHPAALALDKCTSVFDAQTRWRVEWVQVLRPGSTVLLYALGVTR